MKKTLLVVSTLVIFAITACGAENLQGNLFKKGHPCSKSEQNVNQFIETNKNSGFTKELQRDAGNLLKSVDEKECAVIYEMLKNYLLQKENEEGSKLHVSIDNNQATEAEIPVLLDDGEGSTDNVLLFSMYLDTAEQNITSQELLFVISELNLESVSNLYFEVGFFDGSDEEIFRSSVVQPQGKTITFNDEFELEANTSKRLLLYATVSNSYSTVNVTAEEFQFVDSNDIGTSITGLPLDGPTHTINEMDMGTLRFRNTFFLDYINPDPIDIIAGETGVELMNMNLTALEGAVLIDTLEFSFLDTEFEGFSPSQHFPVSKILLNNEEISLATKDNISDFHTKYTYDLPGLGVLLEDGEEIDLTFIYDSKPNQPETLIEFDMVKRISEIFTHTENRFLELEYELGRIVEINGEEIIEFIEMRIIDAIDNRIRLWTDRDTPFLDVSVHEDQPDLYTISLDQENARIGCFDLTATNGDVYIEWLRPIVRYVGSYNTFDTSHFFNDSVQLTNIEGNIVYSEGFAFWFGLQFDEFDDFIIENNTTESVCIQVSIHDSIEIDDFEGEFAVDWSTFENASSDLELLWEFVGQQNLYFLPLHAYTSENPNFNEDLSEAQVKVRVVE